MIIDAHAHLMMMPELSAFRSLLQASNGNIGYETRHVISDELIAQFAKRNVELMDEVGTDIQFLSPRPFLLMHSHPNVQDVVAWARLNNDCIARTIKLYPDRFRGVAGLPQAASMPVEFCFDEIDRAVHDLGFIGVLVNPDPGEGTGAVPPLGDPYWHPLWEKLISLNIPAHIHAAGCCGRETYDEHFASEESLAITSIARARLFDRYPDLKLMISHGGGSIPYQFGRWKSLALRLNESKAKHGMPPFEPFEATLRRFYFDTCIHYTPSLELLIGLVGAERCVFGTERPGSGSAIDPDTGRPMDDLAPVIESIATLSSAEKRMIFEGNARELFPRFETLDA